jgi:hypothetical protein
MMAKKDEGYLLDDSGERVKSGSGDYVRSGSYDDEKVTENRMKAAEEKLAQDVQKKLKNDSDSARVSKDAEERSKAPAPSVKMPTRPGQGAAKPKSGVVTKEQLAKSGFDNLRDYMNAQKGLTRRDGSKTEKAPSKTTTETKPVVSKPADKPTSLMAKADKPAVSSSYRSEGANKAKPAESGSSKPEPYNPLGVRFFKSLRARGEKDLAERGMKKGGSVRGAGIAKQGVRKCKMV